MKNSFAILMLSVPSTWSSVLPNSCEGICSTIDHCQGSYCKSNKVCFGLYKRPDGSLCDFQTDSTCPQSTPVNCPVLTTTTTTTDPTTTATTTKDPTVNPSIPSNWLGSCDTLCEFVPGCLALAKGSYCKAWNNPPLCYALFWTSAAKEGVCTPGGIPNVPCPDTYPVLCSEVGEIVFTSTTPAPSSV